MNNPAPGIAIKAPAAPGSFKLPSGLAPADKSAKPTEKGPEKSSLYQLAMQYEPASFNHAAHVDAADSCAQCHHYITSTEKYAPCRTCHAIAFQDPRIPGLKGAYHRQCMGCHRQMESGPLGCEDCHKPAAASPDHTKLAAANAPETVTLNHLALNYPPVVFDHKSHMANADSCKSCHHKSGPLETTPPCRACHPKDAKPNSPQPGLMDAYHKQCIACHTKLGSGPTDCNGCHKP